MNAQEVSSTQAQEKSSDFSFWGQGWLDHDPEEPARHAQRLQAAKRLREALCGVPFYAKRAKEQIELTGDEMDYWLALQASEPNVIRPPKVADPAQAGGAGAV